MERNGDALDADCASAVDTEMGATVRWGFRLNVYGYGPYAVGR
jgi:hypothetical protein